MASATGIVKKRHADARFAQSSHGIVHSRHDATAAPTCTRLVTFSPSGVLSPWSTEIEHHGTSLMTVVNIESTLTQHACIRLESMAAECLHAMAWSRGFVHFATKEAALRILEESAQLRWISACSNPSASISICVTVRQRGFS